jgi:predicted metal-dependent peptidase
METEQLDYCYTFHNLETLAVREPFAFTGDLPVPMGVALDPETDRIMLLCYYPFVSRLPFDARLAMLKHEAIHIIDGHLGSLGVDLRRDYGPTVSGIACDIYVNQKFNHKPLTDAGLELMTIERFSFPPDLSSRDYAELLKHLINEGGGDGIGDIPDTYIVGDDSSSGGGGRLLDQNGNPVGGTMPQDEQAGTSGSGDGDFTGKGKYRATEVFDITENEASQADQATAEIRDSVESSLKAEEKAWGCGFQGSDYEESIEASKRESTVPWSYYVRMLETSHRADVSVPTRRRLSRRNQFHLGRIRRYGLEVVFMVDTSGSMGEEQLRLVDPELRGLHARGAHITVIHCDTNVAKVHDYSPHQSLCDFHGRGGTEFSAALLKMRELWPRPGLFIGFTDGWGGVETYADAVRQEQGVKWYNDFIARDPTVSPDGVDSLWLIPEGCMDPGEFHRNIVPWGNVVVVPAEKEAVAA